MADAGGWKSKAAFRKDRGNFGAGPAIAYPQAPGASDMASTHQYAFSNESLQTRRERAADDSLVGTSSQGPPDIYRKDGLGPINGAFRWRGMERIVMCALGFEHPDSSPALIVSGAHRHLFEIDYNLADEPWIATEERTPGFNAGDRKVRRGQYGLSKFLEDWVYYSAFINKLTITGSPAEGVRYSLDLLVYDRVKGTYNSVNWTLPAGPLSRVLWAQCVIRLGLRAGGEAGTVDPLCGKFELTVDNKLSAEDQSSGTGVNIEIPVRSDVAEVMLKLERPRYTDRGLGDSTWLTLFDSDSELCGSIVMNGPQIGATAENHKWGFFMTLLKRVEADEPNVDGPGPLRTSWTFRAYSRDPASTDVFATNHYGGIPLKKVSPLVVTTHNADSFDYITET